MITYKLGDKYYRYEVLLIFVVFEVLLYDSSSIFQYLITIAEYFFVAIFIVLNRKVGIMYFISFTLLSMGAWSYITQETNPGNFWGIRIFGFSFNILFSLLILIYCLLKSNIRFKIPNLRFDEKFLTIFILYSFLVGLVFTALSINYADNFLSDVFVYFPFFIYLYYLSILSPSNMLMIVRYCVSVTVSSMILSFFTNNTFQYGTGFYFVLINSFGFIVTFAIFFIKGLYSRVHYFFLITTVIALLASGKIFIGSKTIVVLFVALLWVGLKYKKVMLGVLAFFIFGFLYLDTIISLIEQFDASVMLSYKITQVFEIFKDVDLETVASTPTSIGNIIAECKTTFYYLWQNKLFFFLGKGFGGGISDVFGYLEPMAGPLNGYKYEDAIRNDFVRMHLPIYEIFIKSGIVGLCLYIILLIKAFTNRKQISFVYFILIFMVFYNTKEMMLLTLLFMKLEKKSILLPTQTAI